jgi:hypothetical protein
MILLRLSPIDRILKRIFNLPRSTVKGLVPIRQSGLEPDIPPEGTAKTADSEKPVPLIDFRKSLIYQH